MLKLNTVNKFTAACYFSRNDAA